MSNLINFKAFHYFGHVKCSRLTSRQWICRTPPGRQDPTSDQPTQHLPDQTAGKRSRHFVRRQCVPCHLTVTAPLHHSVQTVDKHAAHFMGTLTSDVQINSTSYSATFNQTNISVIIQVFSAVTPVIRY